MNIAAWGALISGVLTALTGFIVAAWATLPKLRAEAAVSQEDINDRQQARLVAEINRHLQTIDYLRQELRDADRKVRLHREGWWRTYRLATMAGVDLPPEMQPPINGETE